MKSKSIYVHFLSLHMKLNFAKALLSFIILLVTTPIKCQNYSLYFDGYDDYATIYATDTLINPEGFSFEFMIKPIRHTHESPILINSRDGKYLELGLNPQGYLYFETTGHRTTLDQYGPIPPSECTWIGVVYSNRQIHFYINGKLLQTFATSSINYLASSFWTLGSNIGHKEVIHYFNGELDEIRFWNHAITGQAIQKNMVSLVGQSVIIPDFYFPIQLFHLDNQFTPNPFDRNEELVLGDNISRKMNDPMWVPNRCLTEKDMVLDLGENSYKYSTTQTGLANCNPSPSPEVMCNGNFEQIDPVLRNGPLIYNGTTYSIGTKHYNYENSLALRPGSGSQNEMSDVYNWHSVDLSNTGYFHNAYIHVKNGLGARNYGGTSNGLTFADFNYFSHSPNYSLDFNNSNGANDVMVVLLAKKTVNGSTVVTNETGLIRTKLDQSLSNSISSYNISFDVLGSNTHSVFGNNNAPGYPPQRPRIKLRLVGTSGTPDYLIGGGEHTIPFFTDVSPKGWSNFNLNFVPPPQAGNYSHLEVELLEPLGAKTRTIVLYLDNFSISPNCTSASFPKEISLNEHVYSMPPGTYLNERSGKQVVISQGVVNDTLANHHHYPRFIEVDKNGNTYVALHFNYDQPGIWTSFMNSSITFDQNQSLGLNSWSGILIAKYNICGDLEWKGTVYNRNHTELVGLAIDDQNRVQIIGNAFKAYPGINDLVYENNAQTIKSLSLGDNLFALIISENGGYLDFKPANNVKGLDVSNDGNSIKILTQNLSNGLYSIYESQSMQPIFPLPKIKNALKLSHNGNKHYVAVVTKQDKVCLQRYNNIGQLVQTSPYITTGIGASQSMGYPNRIINDLECAPNGDVYIVGNFTKGLDFSNNTPTNNNYTSLFQNYSSRGMGITGFIAKYNANLSFLAKDYLKPQTLPGRMTQVTNFLSSTPSCTPPAAANCDLITTEITDFCVGLTYFCHLTSTSYQWVSSFYPGKESYSSKYHDLSFNPNGDVFVSGVFYNIEWNPGLVKTSNAQQMVVKYDGNLNRKWLEHSTGDPGIENTQTGITTGTAYNPIFGDLSFIGNFIGNSKNLSSGIISTLNPNEHVFVSKVIDFGNSGSFKSSQAEPSAKPSISLYPNPAQTHFFISGLEAKTYKAYIFESSGKLVDIQENFANEPIYTTKLNPGVYLIQISTTLHLYHEQIIVR